MDVDPRPRVGELGDDPRDERRAERVQPVREAMMDHRERTGIADQDLVDAACRRVAEERRLHVGVDQRADLRQAGGEVAQDRLGVGMIERDAVARVPVAEFKAHLREQRLQRACEDNVDIGVFVVCLMCFAEPLGEQRGAEVRYGGVDPLARGEAVDADLEMAMMRIAPSRARGAQAGSDGRQVPWRLSPVDVGRTTPGGCPCDHRRLPVRRASGRRQAHDAPATSFASSRCPSSPLPSRDAALICPASPASWKRADQPAAISRER